MTKATRVEDLMSTAVISLHAHDSVTRVKQEMALADIRHIPVVDDHNHVIGIVSDRDLARAHDRHRHVADIMTHAVRTVRPSTPAAEAAAILMDRKIGSLPVIGAEEQLVGIITETDFLGVARRALEAG